MSGKEDAQWVLDNILKPKWAAEGKIAPQARVFENDGKEWARHYFPYLFTRPYTGYQEEFWTWVDSIQFGEYQRPRIECEPRGVGKSTNAEAAVAKLIATKRRRMVGYVSLNDQKATKHYESIKALLESPALLETYPGCKPKVQKLRDVAANWSRDAIVTADDAMIVPLTLLGSSRGWKSSVGARFDLIVLDDIDELGQSPDYTKKLIDLLKGEILAAGDDNTIVLMPQNLIYRDSICSQVRDHRADILSDRHFCGPYPLLKHYDAEKIDLNDGTGAMQWVITSGEAFDPAIDIPYAEKLLNKFGKTLFDRECQQLTDLIEDDKDFREWDEKYHLITASEFRSVMEGLGEPVWDGRLQIPSRWNVGIGMDWGTTRGHPAAVTMVARPAQNCPMKDCHFVFAEVVKPDFPLDSFVTPELVSPGRVAALITRTLQEWNVQESQVQMRLMSHEASATLATMLIDLQDDIKQFFGKWKAKRGSGVPQIQNLLEINKNKPHPFRKYPPGHRLAGQALQGSPRIFFIVEDGQGELAMDSLGGMFVTGAKNSKGFARARFEMPIYSNLNTGQKKIDDDYVDAFRGLMNVFGATSAGKTEEEKLAEGLEEAGLTNPTTAEQWMTKYMYLERELAKRQEKRERDSDYWESSH